VLPVGDCLIADERVVGTGVLGVPVPDGVVGLDVVAPGGSEPVIVPLGPPRGNGRRDRGRRGGRRQHGPGRPGRDHSPRGRSAAPVPLGQVPEVTERVGEHEFTVSARGFWQVHPGAASTFTEQVMAWLDPRPGERALDLYAGVGLFAVPLAERVGVSGSVLAVESDRQAADAAARHLAAYPWARAEAAPTEHALERLVAAGGRADVVVLDPPRTGAGRTVMEAVAALSPRAVVYVACDPAALARDVATAREHGLGLEGLRVLDAFPMTHHMECLALLRPTRGR
jgi:16S rRNA G966 N2-methylase RsmD